MTKPYFSDYFQVSRANLAKHGAFDVCLRKDLPLFIDPFLLFNSKKAQYQKLHEGIIKYVTFLKDNSKYVRQQNPGLLKEWYYFREVKQNWFGFTKDGNDGHGLARSFADALSLSFTGILKNFGDESIPKGSHLEKVTLIKSRVGKDQISDFTTNLIKGYLAEYTQAFAQKYIAPGKCRKFQVDHAYFNYETGSWETHEFTLPAYGLDYVLLTPRDILTRFENWISRSDFQEEWYAVAESIDNATLRAKINNYFQSLLSKKKKPSAKEHEEALTRVIETFPEILDYYIRYKEQHSELASLRSATLVSEGERLFVFEVGHLIDKLSTLTTFYQTKETSIEASRKRVKFLKHVIEDKDGYKVFWKGKEPIHRESDVQTMFKLCWYGSDLDVNAEVNNGRGPADFKVSHGKSDAAIVEYKLAKSSSLKRNLEKQTATYKKASDTEHAIVAIVYFYEKELKRALSILKDLGLKESDNIILIDARMDNKPSGSKA